MFLNDFLALAIMGVASALAFSVTQALRAKFAPQKHDEEQMQ
jgi:hypothetical protein